MVVSSQSEQRDSIANVRRPRWPRPGLLHRHKYAVTVVSTGERNAAASARTVDQRTVSPDASLELDRPSEASAAVRGAIDGRLDRYSSHTVDLRVARRSAAAVGRQRRHRNVRSFYLGQICAASGPVRRASLLDTRIRQCVDWLLRCLHFTLARVVPRDGRACLRAGSRRLLSNAALCQSWCGARNTSHHARCLCAHPTGLHAWRRPRLLSSQRTS